MSLTYPEPVARETTETDFVPAYARNTTRSKKKVRSWMILAPIGAVVLLGAGAALLANSGEPAAPLAEPVVAPAASPMTTVSNATATTNAIETAPMPVPMATAPVARVEPRATEPARRAVVTPERRAAPVVQTPTPVEATGPRAYSPDPATTELNGIRPLPMTGQSAVAAPSAPVTPPAPAITTQPLT